MFVCAYVCVLYANTYRLMWHPPFVFLTVSSSISRALNACIYVHTYICACAYNYIKCYMRL